jgi:peptide/nickel transport system substrate-binding protein
MGIHRVRSAAVTATVIALILSGCGGAEEAPTTVDENGSTLKTQDINAQDRGTLAQGGEVRIGTEDLAAYWNPMHIDGNQADWTKIRELILPQPFRFDDKGAPTPDPDYITEMTETNADPTTVNFKLNPEAVWGDGSPVDADDWTAMWQACSGENTKFQCASTQGYDKIADIAAGADKFDVTVTFKGKYPDWTQPWWPIVRAESIADPTVFNSGWKALKNEWLSGPFKVDNYNETEKVLTMVPNNKWWGDKPLLDRVIYREVAEDAQAAAFANNEVDVFEIGVNADSFTRAKTVAGGAVRQAAGPDWRHITFNSTAGLLKDKAIREAVVRGLDRESIGASDLAGIEGYEPVPLNNHILLTTQEGYEDVAERTSLNYDPEKAKADLEAAGWVAGADGIRAKDGKPLAVKFMQLTGIAVSENEALQVQNQLRDIGIRVDIVDVPVDQFSTTLSKGEFELIAFSWIGTPYPFLGVSQIYGSTSQSNYANLKMPEVDKNADLLTTETDVAARIKLANDTSAIIWENVHTLPLYQRPQNWATKANLANYGSFGLGIPEWENVGYQK